MKFRVVSKELEEGFEQVLPKLDSFSVSMSEYFDGVELGNQITTYELACILMKARPGY